MAKVNSPRKPQREPFRFDVFIIELAGKFGITGALILATLYIFIKEGSIEQHREFIDKYILLKINVGEKYYFLYLVLAICVLFVGQRSYFRNRIKLKDERIQQLEDYNNLIENKLLKK